MISKSHEQKKMWYEYSPKSAPVFVLSRYAAHQPEQGVNVRFYKKGPDMKVF